MRPIRNEHSRRFLSDLPILADSFLVNPALQSFKEAKSGVVMVIDKALKPSELLFHNWSHNGSVVIVDALCECFAYSPSLLNVFRG